MYSHAKRFSVKAKTIWFFSILTFAASAQSRDEPIGDSGVSTTIAMLELDLKTVYKNKSDIWWIGQRKCLAETVDIVFSRDQIFNMAAKMPLNGKEAVLRDPSWPKFKSLLEYCAKKADSETNH